MLKRLVFGNLKEWISSEYLKNILSVSVGSFVAQIINFFSNLLIGRLYAPDAYGEFALFNYVLGTLLVFGNLKLDINVLIEQKNSKISAFAYVSFVLSLIFSFVSCMIFYAYNSFTHHYFNVFWYIVFVWTYIFMVNNQFNWMFLTRLKEYKFQGFWRIVESIFSNGFIILLYPLQSLGIALGYLISNLIVFIGLSKKTLFFSEIKNFNTSTLDADIYSDIKNNRFIIYQSLLETLQFSLIPFLFSEHSGLIGMYSMSIRIMQVPVRVLILPLTQVFMSNISEYIHQKKSIKGFYRKNFYLMLGVLLPISLMFLLGGKFIFSFLLGKNWSDTFIITNILLAWIMIDILKAPFVQLFYIFKQQKIYYYFYLAIVFSIFFIGTLSIYLNINVFSALTIIAVIETFIVISIIFYTYFLVLRYEKSIM